MNNPYRDRDDPWTHHGDPQDRRDFGQADYSQDYGYDPRRRTGYRKDPGAPDTYRAHPDDDGYRRDEPRTWGQAAGPVESDDRFGRRDEPSDRLIWALVCDRLRRDRLDSSDIKVAVDNGVVILSGTARSRREKRHAENLAEIDGVRDVVNTLRLREHHGWRRGLGF